MKVVERIASKDEGAAKTPEPFTPCSYEMQWISTTNERNLEVAMDIVTRTTGKGRLVTVTGAAGFGKTETTLRWAAEHECVHMLVLEIWKSPLQFLQGLCREHGIPEPPKRTNDCFQLLVERMIRRQKPVFLDEIDLTPQHLNLVRQLSMVTAAPMVLIGEDALIGQITGVRRGWSRVYQALQFQPVSLSDVLYYARKSAGLEMAADAAALIHQSACGQDWRDLERVTVQLVEIANAKRSRVITEEMAGTALKMTLKGSMEAEVNLARSRFGRGKRA